MTVARSILERAAQAPEGPSVDDLAAEAKGVRYRMALGAVIYVFDHDHSAILITPDYVEEIDALGYAAGCHWLQVGLVPAGGPAWIAERTPRLWKQDAQEGTQEPS